MDTRPIGRRGVVASFLAALLLVTVVSPLAAVNVTAQSAGIVTRVQFLHAATDVGEVEIHLNGAEELDELDYSAQSDWIAVDPGSVRVTITADRAGFNYAIFDGVYPVPAGNDYYVVISDALILAGAFDTSSMILQGSRVQVVHASVDTPPVTVTASGNAVALATELQYARTSATSPLPSGTYSIDVALADTGDAVLTQAGVVIDPSMSYLLVLLGDPGNRDRPLEVVVLETGLKDNSGSPVG